MHQSDKDVKHNMMSCIIFPKNNYVGEVFTSGVLPI